MTNSERPPSILDDDKLLQSTLEHAAPFDVAARPELYRKYQESSRRIGAFAPLAQFESEIPFAAAVQDPFGSSKKMAVSSGLLELLTDDEANAVIAHELGHIKDKDLTTAGGIALFLVPAAAVSAAVPKHPKSLAESMSRRAVLGICAGGASWALLRYPLERHMNRRADDWAITGSENPEALRSGLIKIANWYRAHGYTFANDKEHDPISSRIRRISEQSDRNR